MPLLFARKMQVGNRLLFLSHPDSKPPLVQSQEVRQARRCCQEVVLLPCLLPVMSPSPAPRLSLTLAQNQEKEILCLHIRLCLSLTVSLGEITMDGCSRQQ